MSGINKKERAVNEERKAYAVTKDETEEKAAKANVKAKQ